MTKQQKAANLEGAILKNIQLMNKLLKLNDNYDITTEKQWKIAQSQVKAHNEWLLDAMADKPEYV